MNLRRFLYLSLRLKSNNWLLMNLFVNLMNFMINIMLDLMMNFLILRNLLLRYELNWRLALFFYLHILQILLKIHFRYIYYLVILLWKLNVITLMCICIIQNLFLFIWRSWVGRKHNILRRFHIHWTSFLLLNMVRDKSILSLSNLMWCLCLLKSRRLWLIILFSLFDVF